MRRSAVLCVVIGILLTLNVAWADDYNPPPWRTDPPGQGLTTYQRWEFGDNNPTPPPDVVHNPGAVALTITNETNSRLWIPNYLGEGGVWKFEDKLIVELANYNQDNPYKEIWLQLTYRASNVPIIYADDPTGARWWAQLIDEEPIGDYLHATWTILIEPNPVSETIYIEPFDCTTYIDEIVIDTICSVPEPATVCLLGLGAVVLLRRRRGLT